MPILNLFKKLDPSEKDKFKSGCPYQINSPKSRQRICAATETLCLYQNTAYSWVERYICYSVLKNDFLVDRTLTTDKVHYRELYFKDIIDQQKSS